MEVVILQGGLGNQMFQYAFYLAKKQQNASVLIDDYWLSRDTDHNRYELGRLFGIRPHRKGCVQKLSRLIRKLVVFQKKKGIREITSALLFLLRCCGIQIQVGFWQSESYFLPVKKEVLKAFTFDETAISLQTAEALRRIEDTHSVSVHVRCGDFLTEENQKKYGNICTPDYYNRAIQEIKNRVKAPEFFVFSDDVE